MIELVDAKKFAKANDGFDAIEVASNYNGSVLYRYVPHGGLEGKALGLPILFRPDNNGFKFLSREETYTYLDWCVKDVRYEDD